MVRSMIDQYWDEEYEVDDASSEKAPDEEGNIPEKTEAVEKDEVKQQTKSQTKQLKKNIIQEHYDDNPNSILNATAEGIRSLADSVGLGSFFDNLLHDHVLSDHMKDAEGKTDRTKGILKGLFSSLLLDKEVLDKIKNSEQVVVEETSVELDNLNNGMTLIGLFSGVDFDILDGKSTQTLIEEYPNEARAKNNNTAGITRNKSFEVIPPKSGTIAALLKEHNINYTKGSTRPAKEGGYYVKFATIADGLKAQALMRIKSANEGQTIEDRLSSRAVDDYNIPGIDTRKTFTQLTKNQQEYLLAEQIKRESGGLFDEMLAAGYVHNNQSSSTYA